MERYDYRDAMFEDVANAANEWFDYVDKETLADMDNQEITETLYDLLWLDDSVTGNGSGSYTFSNWKAEENLAHNYDLLNLVANDWGIEPTITTEYEHGAEWWDVTIRCYLLAEVLDKVLNARVDC